MEESTVGCLGSEAIVWFLLLKTPEAMLPSLRCVLAILRSHEVAGLRYFSPGTFPTLTFP